jgi:hypothetical protein
MSIASGPNIATSGLVFAYDMSDPSSFVGPVGTNQFAVPAPASNGDVTFALQGTGTFKRIYSGTFDNYSITNNDVVYRYDLTAEGGCYYHGNAITLSAGQYITFTFDYYVSPDAQNYPTVNYLANIEGSTGGAATDPTPSIKGVWKTATIASGVTSAGSYNLLLYPGACNPSYLASSGFILYRNPQVLITSSSNFTAPFVGPFGARSSSQSLNDVTGYNRPTTNSLTYNSTGTAFSFNGTSDSITIPFNASQFTFNNEQTIIIWMKNQSPSTTRRNPYNQAYGGAGTITHENDTGFNYFYGTAGVNNTPYTSHYSPFNVVVNETAQIAITRNTSITAWYKNGALGNTQANPYGATVSTGTSDITIGTGYAGAFGGNLYIVQIYNRALSADEIALNFAAYRGRYGL